MTIVVNSYMFAAPVSLEYPPAALTSNSSSLTGQAYGNGTYTLDRSSFFSGFDAFRAFDKDLTTRWALSAPAYNSSGTFAGSFSTSTLGNGEWIQITLPTAINLTSYQLTDFLNSGTAANTPRSWVVGGTNDASPSSTGNWTIVDTETNISWLSNPQETKTFSVSTAAAFKTYRIVVNVLGNFTPNGDGNLTINEWKLFGFAAPASLEYPPAAMTAASTTISAQSYGNGTYTASASSSAGDPLYAAFKAFDKVLAQGGDGEHWATNGSYPNANGGYGGSTTTNGVSGEWLDIILPAQITLTSYKMTGRDNNLMQSSAWVLMGTNDTSATPTGWTNIDTRTGITDAQYNVETTYTITSNPSSFIRYRVVFTRGRLSGLNDFSIVALAELKLYGF